MHLPFFGAAEHTTKIDFFKITFNPNIQECLQTCVFVPSTNVVDSYLAKEKPPWAINIFQL
jgi:hypothetical protein